MESAIVSNGQEQTVSSNSHMTIDIHISKLSDWLVSRRHVRADWREAALAVRENINNAIQDMPATEELTQLLTGTHINYFHCRRIVELLKATEAGTRNMFGSYGSKRMKDWQEVVKMYEKDDLYLAEAAQLLSRNVSYEVPSLKKQIAKSKQVQKDCTRKQSEYSSLEAETKDKFNKKCKQMGIKGEKVKSELLSLVSSLPAEYDKLAERSRGLKEAVRYYLNFRKYTMNLKELETDLLTTLQFIQEHGNVTVYQLETGRVPTSVVLPESQHALDTEEDTADEIDWGIDFGDAGGGKGIEGIEIMNDINEGKIDLGETVSNGIDWGEVDLGAISLEDGGATITVEDDMPGVTSQDSPSEGVAEGERALTVLDNVRTRTEFFHDLVELDAFLYARSLELGMSNDVIAQSILDELPKHVQQDREAVLRMRKVTMETLQTFRDERMRMMMSIRSSDKYVSKLSAEIEEFRTQAEKFAAMQRLMINNRNEALERQQELEPKLDLIKEKTLVLKNQIEDEISKKYKNRPVNIMGEINVM